MTIAQSKAARRKARRDERYKRQKSGDAELRYQRMRAKADRERIRQMGRKRK